MVPEQCILIRVKGKQHGGYSFFNLHIFYDWVRFTNIVSVKKMHLRNWRCGIMMWKKRGYYLLKPLIGSITKGETG